MKYPFHNILSVKMIRIVCLNEKQIENLLVPIVEMYL